MPMTSFVNGPLGIILNIISVFAVHNPMTSTREEYISDKEKRLSQEAINSPFCSSKPPSRSGSVTESLNGSSSGLSN